MMETSERKNELIDEVQRIETNLPRGKLIELSDFQLGMSILLLKVIETMSRKDASIRVK